MVKKFPLIDDVKLIDFAVIRDARGALTPIEGGKSIPFDIQRVYYLYDVPSGEARAGHSHKDLQQVLIAISGSFDVHLYDGTTRKIISLTRPSIGLYIPRMIWRDIDNFSSNSVCLSLASMPYDEDDYYRSIDDFTAARA